MKNKDMEFLLSACISILYFQLCKTAALSYSKGSPVLSMGDWKEKPQLKKSKVKSKGKIPFYLKSPTLGCSLALLYCNSNSSSNSQVRDVFLQTKHFSLCKPFLKSNIEEGNTEWILRCSLFLKKPKIPSSITGKWSIHPHL